MVRGGSARTSDGTNWAVLRRRGWVVVVTTLLAVGAAIAISSTARVSYRATAIAYVNPGATRTNPGQAAEAAQLATTYAGLIPDDSAILQALAGQLGESVATVHHSIVVLAPSTTGILKLEYKAPTAGLALRGAVSLANALTGAHAVSDTVPPQSVRLASLPGGATRVGASTIVIVLVAVLAGVLLGAILMAIWEWLDARVDAAGQLGRILRVPVSDKNQLWGDAAVALVGRWCQSVPRSQVVAVVSTRPQDADDVERLTSVLARLVSLPAAEDSLPRRKSGGTGVAATSFQAYGAPGSAQVGQQAALTSGMVVLVVVEGTRRADVEGAVRLLTQFGHGPDWAVLLPRRQARRSELLELIDRPSPLIARVVDRRPSGIVGSDAR